jgi:FdhD protein
MARPQAPRIPIARWRRDSWERVDDAVAAEEPLQLLLNGEPLSVIMRTPGHDIELALGLLAAEHVITSLADVVGIRISAESGEREDNVAVDDDIVESNQIDVHVGAGAGRRPQRSFLSSSSCGVCGATTVESLAHDHPPLAAGPRVEAADLPPLAHALRGGQRVFDATGGLHAAGLFTKEGELVTLREDIGRHNAVDKIAGRALLDGRLPLADRVLAVSGRAGYEVVQKALAAGIPILVAVGAPSSLAVATATRFGMTLVGFLRDERFNVYSGRERLAGLEATVR